MQSKQEIARAVQTLVQTLQLPSVIGIRSAFPAHRQLSLYICGLGLSGQQLEEVVEDLVRSSQNTKAATLAMMHNHPKLAFEALRSGAHSSAHRELAIAIAGYSKGAADDAWHESVIDLAKDLDDPHARAILAFVSHGDWHDVLKETSLPLQERVCIALMYLKDDELSTYIDTATAEAVEHGDIEGIVLTGLTERAVPLFENYIYKFSDLQSAVLALSFASPRFFAESRVITWRETYRAHLNTWRMFPERARFDIQCTKLSTPPKGRPTLIPPARQLSLRCQFCEKPLDRNAEHAPSSGRTAQFSGQQILVFGDAKSGTVCPKCGRHMSRCVLCMNWLGVPIPHSKGAAGTAVGKREALKQLVSVCGRCWHSSHTLHAREWFATHKLCPVTGCDCSCVEVDAGAG